MKASEVTDEMLRAVEEVVGFNHSSWSLADPRAIIAQVMSMAPRPSAVKKPQTPELTDEQAYEKFMTLVESESNDERLPHMDEVAIGVIRKRHPELAAQYDSECEKHFQAARVRWSASRVRHGHR